MSVLCDERGQMLPELAAVIPAFFLALVLVVNVGLFVAQAARFDRVCAEVARACATSEEDPASAATALLNTGLAYPGGHKGQAQASVSVEAEHEPFTERRILHFNLRYQILGHESKFFSRRKTLVVLWSRGL